jgi:hypothetical protein
MPKLNIDIAAVVRYLNIHAGKKHISLMSLELGLSISFIQKVAKSQGIEISTKKPEERNRIEVIKEGLSIGKSLSAISKELGLYYNSVYRLVEKYNLECYVTRKSAPKVRVSSPSKLFNPHERENWLI